MEKASYVTVSVCMSALCALSYTILNSALLLISKKMLVSSHQRQLMWKLHSQRTFTLQVRWPTSWLKSTILCAMTLVTSLSHINLRSECTRIGASGRWHELIARKHLLGQAQESKSLWFSNSRLPLGDQSHWIQVTLESMQETTIMSTLWCRRACSHRLSVSQITLKCT